MGHVTIGTPLLVVRLDSLDLYTKFDKSIFNHSWAMNGGTEDLIGHVT